MPVSDEEKATEFYGSFHVVTKTPVLAADLAAAVQAAIAALANVQESEVFECEIKVP